MPYVIIGATPPWAADPNVPKGIIASDKMDVWRAFVGDVVARYGSRTPYFSFYNEPDCTGYADYYGSCWSDHPERYVEALAKAREGVKAQKPDALIIMGGLAGEEFFGKFDPKFLENVLKAGVGRYVDAVDLHYYPAFRLTWEPYGRDVLGKITYYRSMMRAYGAAHVRLMLSEISYPAGGGGEEAQLRYVAQGLTRAAAGQVDVIIWYTLADKGPNHPDPHQSVLQYGLAVTQPDGTVVPKQSFRAYQIASCLLQARPLGALSAARVGDGVEGYAFQTASGTELWSLWSTDENTRTVQVPAPANQIRMTSLTGVTNLLGGQGQVSVPIGPRANYLEIIQGPVNERSINYSHSVFLPIMLRMNSRPGC